jgi:spore coat protein U-like protein
MEYFLKLIIPSIKFFIFSFLAFSIYIEKGFSATSTGSLTANASVVAACSIATGGVIDFGVYDVTDLSAKTANTGTTLKVQCTKNTDWKVYSTQTDATKIMITAGGSTSETQMPYLLYSNSGLTTLLPVTGTVDSVSGKGNGSLQNATIYGKVAPGLNVVAGSYTQIINLSIDY